MRRTSLIISVLATMAASQVDADADTRQYCSEMYPVESYEAEERNQYIAECMQAYGYDDSSAQTSDGREDEAEPDYEEGYYDGTVEEYVDSLPESEAQ